MDTVLRCNTLKCRAQLTKRAIVTTCSHIFCESCASAAGLAVQNSGIRLCPACETQLNGPDDAVINVLNPSEDYKSSVMSGLPPSVIMDCASRAMAFYQYQIAQEITYQEYLAKNLTDKYSLLSSQMDNVIKEANMEIVALREKVTSVIADRKALENKNAELAEAFREKSRAQQHLQGVYSKLKGRISAVAVEDAAARNVQRVVENVHRGQANVVDDNHAAEANRGLEFNGSRPRLTMPPHARRTSENSRGSGGSGERTAYAWHRQSHFDMAPPQPLVNHTPRRENLFMSPNSVQQGRGMPDPRFTQRQMHPMQSRGAGAPHFAGGISSMGFRPPQPNSAQPRRFGTAFGRL